MVVQVNDVGMVASELRLGNYVMSKGIIIKVPSITSSGIGVKSYYNGYDDVVKTRLEFKHIKPIPLTEEILLNIEYAAKCIDEWFINGKCFQIFNGLLYYTAGLGYRLSEPIKYLHQLQNLIFSLTGQELNVKL